MVTKMIFAKLYKRLTNRINKFLFDLKNVKLQTVPEIVGAWPIIVNDGEIIFGSGCTLRSFRTRIAIGVKNNARISIGNGCYINDGVNIYASSEVVIGNNVLIGDMTYIYDTNFHATEQSIPTKAASIKIGNNVWIGANSMILPGAVIGNHSVIAAGSIVKGEIPEKSLAAGIPARVIRMLNITDDWIRV